MYSKRILERRMVWFGEWDAKGSLERSICMASEFGVRGSNRCAVLLSGGCERDGLYDQVDVRYDDNTTYTYFPNSEWILHICLQVESI